ncbi:MAG: adenylate/guanylate cyclase domain-containing protein [Planctomycetes bacterium]|nr:adenylate/guanylate cyclase domain-containing protein [Planctomycetota bacterium]
MSTSQSPSPARRETPLLIAFADITRFMVNSQRTPDDELAELVNAYYCRAASIVSGSGGRVVKFMGDAILAVWPEEKAGEGIEALAALKADTDASFARQGWDSRLVVKAHFGTAVAGPFGPKGDERYDLIGNAVNIAATLPARTFALSLDAFRKLSPEARKRFKKHTPPVVYIPAEDPRP